MNLCHSQGEPLHRVTEYKYLGILITSDLSWTPHIKKVVGKANQRLGYIRRVLKLASPATKLTAYKVLVRPILEYACEVWDPYLKDSVSKLEQVQRRALRFIYSRYRRQDAVTPLYARANLPLLNVRRKEKRLSFFYLIINELLLVDKSRYINESKTRIVRNKHSRHVKENRFHKNCYKYSFFLSTARDWNCLPANIVNAGTREQFSALVSEYFQQ